MLCFLWSKEDNDSTQSMGKLLLMLTSAFLCYLKLEEVKLERCIRMVEKNREAARMFYLNLEKLTQVQNAVAFSLAILVSQFCCFEISAETLAYSVCLGHGAL